MWFAFWRRKKTHPRTDKHIPNPSQEHKPVIPSEAMIVEEITPTESMDNNKTTNPKYHVSQNKGKNTEFYKQWRVGQESSDKTIQFFDTQKQAIDYAQGLATQAKTTVVIHKLDGSIRKQDYASNISLPVKH